MVDVSLVRGAQPEVSAVDIIVPLGGGLQPAIDCLHSVWQCTCEPYRVVAIHDGSDRSVDAILGEFANSGLPLRIVHSRRCPTPVEQVNLGLRLCRGPVMVIVGGYATVTPGWLRALVTPTEADEQVGIVLSGSWRPPDHRDSAHGPGLGAVRKAQLECVAKDPGLWHRHCQCLDRSWMLVRRQVLEAIGYLDDTRSARSCALAKYCLRASRAGFQTALTAEEARLIA